MRRGCGRRHIDGGEGWQPKRRRGLDERGLCIGGGVMEGMDEWAIWAACLHNGPKLFSLISGLHGPLHGKNAYVAPRVPPWAPTRVASAYWSLHCARTLPLPACLAEGPGPCMLRSSRLHYLPAVEPPPAWMGIKVYANYLN